MEKNGLKWKIRNSKGGCVRGKFYGNKAITIDSGGRVKLPSRYLKIIEKDFYGEELVIAYRKSDGIGYLVIIPERKWLEALEKINEMEGKSPVEKERLRRILNRNSDFVNLDKQGRFVIPKRLSEMAEVKSGDDAYLIGNGNFIELWNASKFDEYEEKGIVDDELIAGIFN